MSRPLPGLAAERDQFVHAITSGRGIISKKDMHSPQASRITGPFGPGAGTHGFVAYIRTGFAAGEQQDA